LNYGCILDAMQARSYNTVATILRSIAAIQKLEIRSPTCISQAGARYSSLHSVICSLFPRPSNQLPSSLGIC